jgi:DNA-binding LacI/PurR family transcriptional regulator
MKAGTGCDDISQLISPVLCQDAFNICAETCYAVVLCVASGLTEVGLRIPENYSALGFDDLLLAAVTTPGITTISQLLKAMGCRRPSECQRRWCEKSSRHHILTRRRPKLLASRT